jgi:hypothetical protein
MEFIAISWNIHGLDPPREHTDSEMNRLFLSMILCTNGKLVSNPPSLLIVGLQEMDRSVLALMFPERPSRKLELWTERISEALKYGFIALESGISKDYSIVSLASFGSLGLMVFADTQVLPFIDVEYIRKNSMSCSKGKRTGNKGAVAISIPFILRDEPVRDAPYILTIINAHLPSGSSMTNVRNQAYKEIYKILCSGYDAGSGLEGVFESSMVIFMGDLNYRVLNELSRESDAFIDHKTMRAFDQLTHQMHLDCAFSDGFYEFPVHFAPTFKYDTPLVYSLNRTPSWCDRILFRCKCCSMNAPRPLDQHLNQCIQLVRYDSLPLALSILPSDHQPVLFHGKLYKLAPIIDSILARKKHMRRVDYELNYIAKPSLTIYNSDRTLYLPTHVLESLCSLTDAYKIPMFFTIVENTGAVSAEFSIESNKQAATCASMTPENGILDPKAHLELYSNIFPFNINEPLSFVSILHINNGSDNFLTLNFDLLPTRSGVDTECKSSIILSLILDDVPIKTDGASCFILLLDPFWKNIIINFTRWFPLDAQHATNTEFSEISDSMSLMSSGDIYIRMLPPFKTKDRLDYHSVDSNSVQSMNDLVDSLIVWLELYNIYNANTDTTISVRFSSSMVRITFKYHSHIIVSILWMVQCMLCRAIDTTSDWVGRLDRAVVEKIEYEDDVLQELPADFWLLSWINFVRSIKGFSIFEDKPVIINHDLLLSLLKVTESVE